ncbi:MAG: peptidoglycan-binding protein, partial [Clostridia bacterium]|nr:peptidoglycan-binding protein [Clostridia bacterium]
AGIQKSVINNASYAHVGNNPYYFNVKYYSRGSYSPKPGDLIFYDWANTDRNWDHVGIICYIENGYIYAVEGNASEQVLIRRVSKNNYEIQGFGAPNYTSGSASALQVSNYTEPASSLSSGSTGGGVKWLQCALLHLGYPCPVDGSFGANLKRQLKRFQKDVGLEVTGVCTANDRAAIRSRLGSGPIVSSDPNSYPVPTRTLKKDMTGEDVKWLQAVLKKMGASVAIDGGFGPATETKVKWAQKKLGLTADGIVGPATRKKLIEQVGGSSDSSGSSSGYPVPTRTLKEGMSGDDVKWLQSALRKLGSAIPVTGYFGSATRASVVSFQRSKGLTADGIVGPATRAKLVSAVTPSSGSSGTSGYPEPTRTLRVGCKGNDVKWLQSALRGLGYTITVDGSFGPGTESVVKTFQRAVGLAVDGVVGPATRAQIKLKIQ